MDDALARRLMTLTSQFYDHVAPSFSATRQHPWEGWARLWDEAAPLLAPCAPDRPLRAIDVGCGNLRFGRFLEAKVPGASKAKTATKAKAAKEAAPKAKAAKAATGSASKTAAKSAPKSAAKAAPKASAKAKK